MKAQKAIAPRLLLSNQADAAFNLLFLDTASSSVYCNSSLDEGQFDHARFALWVTYKLIVLNHNPSDKQIIFFLKNKFDIKSEVSVKCLKALDSIFEATNSFSYNRNENCKRYNTHNKDQELITSWCLSYQDANPETQFLQSRLKIK